MPRGRPPKAARPMNEVLGTEELNPKNEQIMEGNVMQSAEQEVSTSKTKGTPPGWKPASQLPMLKARPGWTAKWSNPAKLTERLSEGWKVMKPQDNEGDEIVNIDVNDVGSLTGALRYRDLVAIQLPNELKAQRDKWLRNENNEAMKGVLRDTDEKLKEGGVETYTPKGQAGRIVIN